MFFWALPWAVVCFLLEALGLLGYTILAYDSDLRDMYRGK